MLFFLFLPYKELIINNILFFRVFFSSIIGAEMKKVSYNVKVVTSQDSVLNSACECPAGSGPHSTCKHVVALLLSISEFTETGELKVTKSCTEQLQSFKRPRKENQGSPVKVILFEICFQ